MSAQGLTTNFTIVEDENGDISCGIHYTDTSGADINLEAYGDDYYEVLSALLDDFAEELEKDDKEEETELDDYTVNVLKLENDQLHDEVEYLREYIKALEDENEALRKPRAEKSTDSSLYKDYEKMYKLLSKIL